MRRCAGFTTIELITVIVILGILAVVAMPRLNNADNRAAVFRDQTVSALRYAQKTAVSHRRTVCVAFTATTVTLTIAAASGGACGPALPLPGSTGNVVQSGDIDNAVFNPVPAGFSFAPDGRGADRVISVAGQAAITVVGATGHVN
jgi:MSHA pilin protein MshC